MNEFLLQFLIFTSIAVIGGVLLFLLIQLNGEPTYNVINPSTNSTMDIGDRYSNTTINEVWVEHPSNLSECKSNTIQYNLTTDRWECGIDCGSICQLNGDTTTLSEQQIIEQKLDKIIGLLEKNNEP